jgi:GDPmannose 4,6-dehydratase
VIATGVQHSVRQFAEFAAAELGITLEFSGSGIDEIGVVSAVDSSLLGAPLACRKGDVVVRVDPRYHRPTEVETLLGDPSKAKRKLGWVPTTDFRTLVREMAIADFTSARRDSMLKTAGFPTFDFHE